MKINHPNQVWFTDITYIPLAKGFISRSTVVGIHKARAANLPSESAVSFLAALGSMIAAHTMAARFHADGRLSNRELRLTGVLNTVPFHVKETLTFQMPVVLPLLGPRLSMIYITAFWLTGVLKLAFVLILGRLNPPLAGQDLDAFEALKRGHTGPYGRWITHDPHDPAAPHPAPVYSYIRSEERGCHLWNHHGLCHVVQAYCFDLYHFVF